MHRLDRKNLTNAILEIDTMVDRLKSYKHVLKNTLSEIEQDIDALTDLLKEIEDKEPISLEPDGMALAKRQAENKMLDAEQDFQNEVERILA